MKTILIYSKNFSDIIINIDYIVSIRKKYYCGTLGRCDYIITMVKGDDIYIENYHFEQVKEKFKEMGVI
jgi:hypothetical protein